MFDTYLLLFGSVVVFIAGIARGITGFGIAVVGAPLLILLFPPKIIIPTILLLAIVTNVPIFLEARRFLNFRRIVPLIVASIIGMPFGTYLLIALDPRNLKIIIGGTVLIFAIAMRMGFKRKIKNEKVAFVPVGLLAGLLQGAISMAGPPVALFFSNQGMMKQAFRVNTVTYLFILQVATFIAYAVSGLITPQVVQLSTVFLVPIIAGAFAGITLAKKVQELLFRKIVLTIVILSGTTALVSGIRLYLY